MRRRRVSSFVLSCFIICSIISGPTSASGIFDLDEMGIDPWGDMEQLPGVLPGLPQVPETGDGDIEPAEDVQTAELFEDDSGIDLQSIVPDASPYDFHMSGITFSARGYYNGTAGGSNYNFSFGPGASNITGSMAGNFTATISTKSQPGSWSSPISMYSSWTVTSNNPSVYVTISSSNPMRYGGLVNLNGSISFYLLAKQNTVQQQLFPNNLSLSFYSGNSLVAAVDAVKTTNSFTFNSVEVEIPSGGYDQIRVDLDYSGLNSSFNLGSVSVVQMQYYLQAIFNSGSLTITYVENAPEDVSIGLLGSIIEFLQNIVNGISNIGKGIVELPGKIVTALIDGLKSLFIPSESDITSITGQYEALFLERLGFVYQAYSWLVSFASDFLTALKSTDDYAFVFPAVTLPVQGVDYTFIPETTVDLDNDLMATLRPVLGTIVSFVSVIAFVNMSFSMVTALISGVSYFDFLKAGKGGGDGG